MKIFDNVKGVKGIVFAIFTLLFSGLLIVFSGSTPYSQYKYGFAFFLFEKQLIFAIFSIFLFFILLKMDLDFLSNRGFVYFFYVFTILLLIIPYFLPQLNHTRRWIYLKWFSFQPSEVAKLAIILLFAKFLSEIKEINENIKKNLIRIGIPLFVIILLIFFEPDFGNFVIIMGFAVILLFFKGIRGKYIAIFLVSIIILTGIYLLLHGYAEKRVLDFLSNFASYKGSNFQTKQSLIAVGHSGFWGCGPGNSVEKLFFLPAPYSDFIFALLCEEFGFIGAFVVIFLYLFIVIKGILISLKLEDDFFGYLGLGISIMLLLHVVLNISMVLNLIPTKGVALPLMSMGGSSLLVNMLELGILCNILIKRKRRNLGVYVY